MKEIFEEIKKAENIFDKIAIICTLVIFAPVFLFLAIAPLILVTFGTILCIYELFVCHNLLALIALPFLYLLFYCMYLQK